MPTIFLPIDCHCVRAVGQSVLIISVCEGGSHNRYASICIKKIFFLASLPACGPLGWVRGGSGRSSIYGKLLILRQYDSLYSLQFCNFETGGNMGLRNSDMLYSFPNTFNDLITITLYTRGI